MKGRSAFCAAILALLLGAAELMAGTVYVPVATNKVINGFRYQTQVWLTNTGTQTARFSTIFIPTVADGTDRDAMPDPIKVPLAPGGTFFLNSIAPDGQRGLVEVDADSDIIVTARLVTIRPNGTEMLGAGVPILSSDNLVSEGATAHIQGVERAGQEIANLGVVNLGFQEATCTLRAFRITGQQIADTAVVTLPPLTQAQFDDVLGFIGVPNVADARFSATCDQNFYVYTTLYDRASGDAVFLAPSTEVTSALQPPGENPQVDCAPGAECFTVPGLVHRPTSRDRVKRVSFQVPPGAYKIVRANMDIAVGPWANGNRSGRHNLFWLARNVNKDLIGYLNVNGPNANSMLCRHNFNTPQHLKAKFQYGLALQPGVTYNFDYTYDTANDLVEILVKQAGNIVGRYGCGRPNVGRVNIDNGDLIHIDFGFSGVNPSEPPTIGWEYRNLLLEFTR